MSIEISEEVMPIFVYISCQEGTLNVTVTRREYYLNLYLFQTNAQFIVILYINRGYFYYIKTLEILKNNISIVFSVC